MTWGKTAKNTSSFSGVVKPTSSFSGVEKPASEDHLLKQDGDELLFQSGNSILLRGEWVAIAKPA